MTEFCGSEPPLTSIGNPGAGVAANAAAEAERDGRLWDLRADAARLVSSWLWALAGVQAITAGVSFPDRLTAKRRLLGFRSGHTEVEVQ